MISKKLRISSWKSYCVLTVGPARSDGRSGKPNIIVEVPPKILYFVALARRRLPSELCVNYSVAVINLS
jgi:hypothetical protein